MQSELQIKDQTLNELKQRDLLIERDINAAIDQIRTLEKQKHESESKLGSMRDDFHEQSNKHSKATVDFKLQLDELTVKLGQVQALLREKEHVLSRLENKCCVETSELQSEVD